MISIQDQRLLSAAEGWIGLGNYVEADAELDLLPARVRAFPSVLKIRWQIYAGIKNWEGAFEIATAIRRARPRDSFGWIHAAFALHALNRTQEAWDFLFPAHQIFPCNSMICYNLACYASRLGHIAESRRWLERAIELGDSAEIRITALNDPDLEALWQNMGKL